MGDRIRLQKFLSRAGVASRRAAEDLIRAGRIRVNGEVVTELGRSVDPEEDRVEVDRRAVTPAEPLWIALHKPAGYVTTRRDPQGRPTVYDLLPAEYAGLFHVGRLDANTEGLLLLTNRGDAANRLLHPRYGVERVYDVIVRGAVTDADLRRIVKGVILDDGPARASSAERLSAPAAGASRVRVTMREGRKREVRRIFEAIGHPVRRLTRRRFGPIPLGRLAPGAWRRLTPREVRVLETGPGAAG